MELIGFIQLKSCNDYTYYKLLRVRLCLTFEAKISVFKRG